MSTSESQSHAPLELRSFIDRVPAIAWSALPDGSLDFFNQRFRDYTGLSSDQLHGSEWKSAVHPDDIQQFETWRQTLRQSQEAGTMKVRLRRFDGEYRWFQIAVTPLHDEQANLVRWCGINTDIDDLKCSEQKVHQETGDLTITDAIPIGISVLAPDGTTLYMNPLALDRIAVTLEEVKGKVHLERACHPDDRDRVLDERRMGLSKGVPFKLEVRLRLRNGEYRWYLSQYNPLLNERGQIMRWYVTATDIDVPFDREMRCLRKSGQYRWQLLQYNPLKDERGRVIRWYATATDIDDRRRTEERLRNENLVLREEIDRSSMFEEIVGSSKPMRQVLKQVEKVASADSTVLILGETGTGKELIARALHRRSKRASRAFIRVNCAAIPQSLIASELFGHEKGAFTGALQRRLGRFEAADGGTLFLDEIGDLPMETQIGLLRVLQEKEFERVGSNAPISVDVRLIAATNRDLPAAVAAGMLRRTLCQKRRQKRPADRQGDAGAVEELPLAGKHSRVAERRGTSLSTDIDDRKRAEEKLRQSEENLRTITDTIRQPIAVLAADGTTLYANRVALDFTGPTQEEVIDQGFFPRAFHPDDVERVRAEREERFLQGVCGDSQ